MKHIILNPLKNKKNRKKLQSVCNRLDDLKIEYEIHETSKPKEAIEIAKQITSEGNQDVIAFGGDGMLNEVLNGFTNFETCTLGLIPTGTGNDFASCVGIPTEPLKALEIILKDTPKFTDFMQMPTVRGINLIGAGIDVDVLKNYEAKKIKTKLAYLNSLIVSLFKFKKYTFEYECNEKKEKVDSFIACVANGKTIGGGIKMCPNGVPDDGELDLVVCKFEKKSKIPASFVQLMKGKILEQPFTHYERCQKVKISSDTPFTVQVDGELYDNIPFEVEIVKNQLKMYRP